jgi:hypothetical protein
MRYLRYLRYLRFSGSENLGWALSDQISGMLMRESHLILKALCGFWENLITTFKVDPCMYVCLFVRSFRHFVGC